MNVLHIAGGFAKNGMYERLVSHLGEHVDSQFVFAPVRSASESARKPEDVPGAIQYELRHMLKPYHRVLFRTKVNQILKAVCSAANPSTMDLTHAHTLFSDGAVSLKLKEQFGIPYIVAFRNTDLNVFMRWRPDLWPIGRQVLEQAAHVVFVSPVYRSKLLARLDRALRNEVDRKSRVLPNGLDEFWLDSATRVASNHRQLRLLYVGNATRNKNIETTLQATEILARRRPVELTLVGAGRNERRVQRWLDRYKFANHLGRVDDRYKLRKIYREHDIFVMPSFRETFGVVYLEALSQGLPVVHSKGQGIDGYFPEGTISEGVDPHSPSNVAAGIQALSKRLSDVRHIAMEEARKFSWAEIVVAYAGVYAEALARRSPDS